MTCYHHHHNLENNSSKGRREKGRPVKISPVISTYNLKGLTWDLNSYYVFLFPVSHLVLFSALVFFLGRGCLYALCGCRAAVVRVSCGCRYSRVPSQQPKVSRWQISLKDRRPRRELCRVRVFPGITRSSVPAAPLASTHCNCSLHHSNASVQGGRTQALQNDSDTTDLLHSERSHCSEFFAHQIFALQRPWDYATLIPETSGRVGLIPVFVGVAARGITGVGRDVGTGLLPPLGILSSRRDCWKTAWKLREVQES